MRVCVPADAAQHQIEENIVATRELLSHVRQDLRFETQYALSEDSNVAAHLTSQSARCREGAGAGAHRRGCVATEASA